MPEQEKDLLNEQPEQKNEKNSNKIRFKATKEEFYRGLMVGERLGRSRKRNLIIIPTLILIAGIYGWDILKNPGYTQGVLLFCLSLLLLAFAIGYPRLMARKVAARFAALPYEFVVEIGKKAIYVDYNTEHTELGYESDAVEVIDSRKFFVINYRRTHVFIIPKAYMTEQQILDAQHIFLRRIPQKYKLVQYKHKKRYGR